MAGKIRPNDVFRGNGYEHHPLVKHRRAFNIDRGDDDNNEPMLQVLPVPLSLLSGSPTRCQAEATSVFIAMRISSCNAHLMIKKRSWNTWKRIDGLATGDYVYFYEETDVVSVMMSGCMVFDAKAEPAPFLFWESDTSFRDRTDIATYCRQRLPRTMHNGIEIRSALAGAGLNYEVHVQKSGMPLELTADVPMWVVYDDYHDYTAIYEGNEERGTIPDDSLWSRGGAYLLNAGVQMTLSSHLLSIMNLPLFQRVI